ncbi:MAG: hypothetical protein K2N48_02885 [Muribaculaceae bacterium]|nr:hypothetical protein [Muribaculaceae bacterium]
MSNAAALKTGTAKAKRLIEDHILNQILIPTAKGLIQAATEGRVALGHNMTGNTINSYAAGVYANGVLVHIETSAGSIPNPLRRKLGRGQRFYAGSQRWDGETQEHTFTAQAGSNGTMEAERSIAFLQSHKPSANGFALVVCNGVEYATYQENEMNIDVLTSNFDYVKMFAPSMFKPLPE